MTFTFFATIPARAQDISSGLVGHWKLDETSGTDVIDYASNNNGTMQGGLDASADSTTGRVDAALDFDGGDYIDLGNILLSEIADFPVTVSAWVYTRSVKGAVFTLDDFTANGDRQGLKVSFRGQRLSGFYYPCASDVGSCRMEKRSSDAVVPLNTWVHLSVVFADPSNVKLYVDGKEVAGGYSGSAGNLHRGTKPARIGLSSDVHDTLYQIDGLIDDVRVYNRALAAEDIAALYAAWPGHLRYNTDYRVPEYFDGVNWIAMGSFFTVPTTGLKAHWAFDETSGTTVADSTGNGRTGTWNGSANVNSTSGKIEGAFTFVPASAQHIDVLSSTLDGSSKLTISAWVKPASCTRPGGITTMQSIVGKWDNGSSERSFILGMSRAADNCNLHLAITDDGGWVSDGANGVTSTGTLALNEWSHVTATYDGATKEAKIYINGQLDNTNTLTDPVANTIYNSGAVFSIGATSAWANDPSYFNGSLDDVRVYHSTLGPAEVLSLYEATRGKLDVTSNLVAHWQLDETSGSAIVDVAGPNNAATWFDGANNDVAEETVPGKIGQALEFNNSSTYITAPGLASTDQTLSAWVYPRSRPVGNPDFIDVLFWKGNHLNAGHLSLGLYPGGTIGIRIRSTGGDIFCGSGGAIVPLNEWHLVTGAQDATNGEFRVYIDGLLKNTCAISNITTNADTWYLGRQSSTGIDAYHFDGYIDDMRIYNRALDDAEVLTLYSGTGACSGPERAGGTIIYNEASNVMQYCDGDNWQAMGPVPGPGGGGCSDPVRNTGSMIYNADFNAMQYCDGFKWVAVNADPCAVAGVTPGTACRDGTIYVGLTPDGNFKMYTTPDDAGAITWNDGTTSWTTTGFTSTTDGDGNTMGLAALADAGAPYNAAIYCDGLDAHGHQDWYLPAQDELRLFYTNNIEINDINAYYWSSTEDTADNRLAWGELFSIGNQALLFKHMTRNVRCVRK